MIRQTLLSSCLLLVVALPGCLLDGEVGKNSQNSTGTGGSGGSSAAGGSSGAAGTAPGGSGGVAGSTGGSAGTAGSAGSAGSAGTGGTDWTKPNPPAGYTKCGSGSFDNFHSNQVCKSVWTDPQFGVLFDPTVKDPNNPNDLIPRACDDVSITAGQYEVWCSGGAPQNIYLWAKLDGVEQTKASCPAIVGPVIPQLVGIEHFMEKYPKGWGGGSPGNGIVYHDPQFSTAYVVLNESDAGPSGKGRIWVGGERYTGAFCVDQGPYELTGGFEFSWL